MMLQNPLMLLLALTAVPLLLRAYRNGKKEWQIAAALNALLLLVLSLAAASPAVQVSEEQVKKSEIVYLNDQSRSMMSEGSNISIEGVSLDERIIASGNSSELDRALLNSVEYNTTYLVRSDLEGLENPRKVLEAFESRNSSLNFLQSELPEETSVAVTGPSVTVPGAENSFDVRVDSTHGGESDVTVTVDGEQVKSGETDETLEITEEFTEEGYHTVKATIEAEDMYGSNNQFYRTVKVIEKPEILVVGEPGQLDQRLSDFYDITVRNSLPDDLSQYYAVILKKKLDSSADLKPYLIEGNGLMYTGDGSMEVLPVEKTQERRDTENPAVVLSIDISEGLGGKCAEWATDEKNICLTQSSDTGAFANSRNFAFNVVANLRGKRPGTIMGTLAYNQGYLPLHEPEPLRKNGEELQDKISRIGLEGIAYHRLGVEKASEMFKGNGNIILITDGNFPADGGTYGPEGFETFDVSRSEYQENLVDVAENLPDNKKLYTVAVGEEKSTDFLSRLAKAGGGVSYGSPEEFYQQPPTFVGGGGTSATEILKVVSSSHFIIRGMAPLKVATSKFDTVKVKPSADSLVTSTGGKPALSSWRYGLGRVASFSTGGRDLERILSQEPGLVSRSASWAVGDPRRKEESTVEIESARRGEEVVVSSDRKLEGLTRKPGGSYETGIRPDSLGIHSFQEDHLFSYNYRREIQELGYREDVMDRLAEGTGGKVVSPDEVGSLASQASTSARTVAERRSLTPYLLFVALLLFLVQVGYRKLNGLL